MVNYQEELLFLKIQVSMTYFTYLMLYSDSENKMWSGQKQ